MAEHLHAIDMCPDCDGLRVVEASRFEATDVRFDGAGGSFVPRGPVTITLSPLPDPCPNPRPKEAAGE